MIKNDPSCVLYLRSRPGEPFANEIARRQSNLVWDGLKEEGYQIAGAYGDDEFAKPGEGWMEHRWGWLTACNHAKKIARKRGHCSLFITRSAGIGSGDPFLPDPRAFDLGEDVDVRVAGDDLQPCATSNLQTAWTRQQQFAQAQEEIEHAKPSRTLHGKVSGELRFDFDPWRKLTTISYCNASTDPLRLEWSKKSRQPSGDVGWSGEAAFPFAVTIQPRRALHLATFVQGTYGGAQHLWTFRHGYGRETRTGHILFGSGIFRSHHRGLVWRYWEPKPLRAVDFEWMDSPHLQTDRVLLRNWESSDISTVAQLMEGEAPLDVERHSGEWLEAGKQGPSMLVIESKSDGAVIGICGPCSMKGEEASASREVDIYCFIGKSFRQQGFALEATRECIRFLLVDLALQSEGPRFSAVTAPVRRGDQASRALVRRLGMSKHGQDAEHKFYRLANDRFARLRRSELQVAMTSH